MTPLNNAQTVEPNYRAIDYDRGVIIKIVAQLGMDVFMYVDDPGVFYSATGNRVSEELASQAGYDVKALGQKRDMKLRMQKASDAIREEYRAMEALGGQKTVVKELNGFKVVDLGGGRYVIETPEGDQLTAIVEKDIALKVLPQIAGVPASTVVGGGVGPGPIPGSNVQLNPASEVNGDVPRHPDPRRK